jgi:deoxyribose-phosphate aldolase
MFDISHALDDEVRHDGRALDVGPQVQVKAAGGVRSLDAILEVIDVGVTRVGVTATITILEDFKAKKGMS